MTVRELFPLPPLSAEDEKLIEAYLKVGKPVDKLAYTEEFDRLVEMVSGRTHSLDEKYLLFQRLLSLRKRARLPRLSGEI
ncbi:MAG: hypothetical protein K2X38_20850 [Gemmataceae bacterium]|nr:hypothetical protein [Gemmataceae bacterium]